MVTDGFMEENGIAPIPKKENRTPKYMSSPRNLKYSQALATKFKKKINAPQKNYLGIGGVYNMENNDTNTDYHIFVRLADQK